MPQKKIIDDVPDLFSGDVPDLGLDDVPDLEFPKKESIFNKAKKKVDTFIGAHLEELGEKKPGILNPNPEQNPLIAKSLLPETKQEPGVVGAARHWGYENIIRPAASPLGILGTYLGEGNPVKEPIGLPKAIGNVEPPPITTRLATSADAATEAAIQTARKPRKPRIKKLATTEPPPIVEAPPIAPTVESPVVEEPLSTLKVGQNKVQLPRKKKSSITSETGAVGPGTGDIAQRQRVAKELRQMAKEDASEGEYKMVASDINLDHPLNEGETYKSRLQAYVGEQPLSAKPPTSKSVAPTVEPIVEPVRQPKASDRWRDALDELDRTGARDTEYRDILSTGSREPLRRGETWRDRVVHYINTDQGKVLRSKDVTELQPSTLPESIASEANVEPAIKEPRQFRYDRRGHITGRFIKKDMPVEADMFERGELEPKPEPSHESFIDNLRQILAERGGKLVKDETGAVTIPARPVHEGLRTAIEEWGHGRNVSDLLETDLEKSANNTKRDRTLLKYMRSIGMDTKGKGVPGMLKAVRDIDAKAGSMMSGYFSRHIPGIKKTADIVSGTKNLALSGGAPGRTGQISAHGFNILRSDLQAEGFKEGFKNFFAGSINPEEDLRVVRENKPMIKKLVEHGMTWVNIEDHSALGRTATGVDRIPVIGPLNLARKRVFEDPIFQVHLPAVKLKQAMKRYNQLLPTLGEKEALKDAAKFANDFSGGVDKTFRNKTYSDLSRIFILAPDWLESRFNVAKKGLTGKPGYTKALARGALIPAPSVIAGVAAKGAYNYLTKSKAAESTGIPAGEVDIVDSRGRPAKKQRSIDLLGTAVEPHRAVIQAATQLAQGDLRFPLKYLGNKASIPLQTFDRLFLSGIDPYGNPLSGKDRFGRPIPKMTALANIAQEAGRPFTPGFIQALADYYRGKTSKEEIISKFLELPINYSFKDRPKPTSSDLPRLRD